LLTPVLLPDRCQRGRLVAGRAGHGQQDGLVLLARESVRVGVAR
jgi:hypothetical protein